MPDWKLRSPDKFPAYFQTGVRELYAQMVHGAVQAEVWLASGLTKGQTRFLGDKFRHFRWCIRQHPMHQFHHLEEAYDIKTACRTVNGEFYEMFLTMRRKLDTSDLSLALEKARTSG